MIFDNLKIKNIDFVVRFNTSASKFSAKNRNNHIIGLKLGGSANHTFSDRSSVLKENDIYFFNQREDYDVEIIEPGLAFSVHFTTYEPIETESFFIPLHDSTEVYRQLCRVEKYWMEGRNSHELMAEFFNLCGIFTQIRNKNYSPRDRRAFFIKSYVDSHFAEEKCLDSAAKKCELSRRRFNDIFKQQFDTTPGRYLINLKIDYAKKLLRSKELGIGDIAEMCGFSDIYYFGKVFKKETDMTPGEFRGL